MRYHIVTLGCAKNVADSERIARVLGEGAHAEVGEPAHADVVIVNTCGFIDASKEESVSTVLELAANKRPGQRLVVAGCLTALHGEELRAEIPQIDAVFGAEDWTGIGAYARTVEPVTLAEPPFHIPETPPPLARSPRPSAYLKISDGCNAPCTFCIIPKMKGKLHSTPADQIVAEARRLAGEGVREIVLVAQDSTDYGRDLGLRDGLPELLERLSGAVPDVPWIRIMYAYPGHVTKRLAETMARLPNVVPYIDIPLQHASETVLRRMRRPSNTRMVREMFETLREAMPDIAIRTTFIVGYPGETEAEFNELLAFVREMAFDRVGCFTFSPQAESPAAHEPDQVPEKVKRRRQRQLMEVAQQVSLIKNRAMVGREIDVLVESSRAEDEDGRELPFVVGRSYRDAPEVDGVVLLQGASAPGQMVRARVTQALAYDVVAEPLPVAAGA
ncbi:MAG TPA: 30S ribosomal protein S12 methylthiotransferase RimO [Dehalococcoidia bacterium]|nr:30S ribosomal protein S12 methylthiotransferase RimO [Dehalococcoidia bacterium]